MEEGINETDLLEIVLEILKQVDSEENSRDEDYWVNKLTLTKLRQGLIMPLVKNLKWQ